MKRSARNLIHQIQIRNGKFECATFPVGVIQSEEEMEQELNRVVAECETRKQNFESTYYQVQEANNHDINKLQYLAVPAIDIMNLCGLLLSAILETDNELRALLARTDQLEAENMRLKRQSVKIQV
jgi:hypothetical protein